MGPQKVHGFLILGEKETRSGIVQFSDEDSHILEVICMQAGIAIENLLLIQILEKADMKVSVGLYESEFDKYDFSASNNEKVIAAKIVRENNKLFLKDFEPDLVFDGNNFIYLAWITCFNSY